MTNRLIKNLSGAAAVAIVAAVAFAPGAKAACAWNGYSWDCGAPVPGYPAPQNAYAYPPAPPAYPVYPVAPAYMGSPVYPSAADGRYPGPKTN